MNASGDYLVYKKHLRGERDKSVASEADCNFLVWRPSLMAYAPGIVVAERRDFVINWVLALPQLLRGREAYCVPMLLDADGKPLAQCIATGASSRFPFMGRQDIQIGAVYVPDSERGKGYGKLLTRLALAAFDGERHGWWICHRDNTPSIGTANSCGFELIGSAQRTKSLGIPRYLLCA